MSLEENEMSEPAFTEDKINWLIDRSFTRPRKRLEEWRHWRNVAPSPDHRPVRVKGGRIYWLLVSEQWGQTRVAATYRNSEVGEMYLRHRQNESAAVLDILYLIRPHRKWGLGTALLGEAEKKAGEWGAKEIYGYVILRHLKKTPRLLEWYEGHGFSRAPVDNNDPEAPISAVAKIRKRL